MNSSKFQFSPIIIGTMRWGVWGANFSAKEMTKNIEKACSLGLHTFDSAPIYGFYTTEKTLGDAFQKTHLKRQDYQIITKFGIQYPADNQPFKLKHYNHTKENIKNSVEQSLNDLQTDYLDVLLVHRPGQIMDLEEIAETFEELKSEGKVLHFGASNFTATQQKWMHQHFPLRTNQIEFSLNHLEPLLDDEFLEMKELGIIPSVWSPLGGVFSEKNEKNDQILRVLQTLSEKHQISKEGVLMAWMKKIPGGMVPVIGTSRSEQFQLFLEGCSVEITSEEWYEILVAATGHKVP